MKQWNFLGKLDWSRAITLFLLLVSVVFNYILWQDNKWYTLQLQQNPVPPEFIEYVVKHYSNCDEAVRQAIGYYKTDIIIDKEPIDKPD